MINNQYFIIIFVILLTITGQFSGVLYLPSLPAIAMDLNEYDSYIKLIPVSYLLGFGISQLFFGPLSDKLGRKKLLNIGLFISLLGNLLSAMSTNLIILILSRIIVGIGSGATASISRAILRDFFNDKMVLTKSISIIGTFTALSPAIGPAIGGMLQEYLGWRFNFILLASCNGIISFISMALYSETNITTKSAIASSFSQIFYEYPKILKNELFLGSLLCAAFAFSGLIAYEISAPFFYQNKLGLSASQFGYISLIVAGSISLGSLINSWVSPKLANHIILIISGTVCIFAGILLLQGYRISSHNILIILIPSMIFGCTVGIIFPIAIANVLSLFPKSAGSASAIFGCSQMIIAMAINAQFSFIDLVTITPLAVIFILVGVLISLVTLFFLSPKINVGSLLNILRFSKPE